MLSNMTTVVLSVLALVEWCTSMCVYLNMHLCVTGCEMFLGSYLKWFRISSCLQKEYDRGTSLVLY